MHAHDKYASHSGHIRTEYAKKKLKAALRYNLRMSFSNF